MAVADKLYSDIVNEAISLKTNNPAKDTNKIVEEVVTHYTKDLGLSEDNIGDLLFQVSFAVVNKFRD